VIATDELHSVYDPTIDRGVACLLDGVDHTSLVLGAPERGEWQTEQVVPRPREDLLRRDIHVHDAAGGVDQQARGIELREDQSERNLRTHGRSQIRGVVRVTIV